MAEMWIDGKSMKTGSERTPDRIEQIAIRKQEEIEEYLESRKTELAAEIEEARAEASSKSRFDEKIKQGWSLDSDYGRSVATGKPFQTKTGSHLW